MVVQETEQSQSKSVTLDANGQGTVFVGPSVAGTRWTITNMVSDGNSAVQPVLKVYRGNVGAQYILNGTMMGNLDANTDNIQLNGNEKLACQYTGGTPGALMTINVYATQKYGI